MILKLHRRLPAPAVKRIVTEERYAERVVPNSLSILQSLPLPPGPLKTRSINEKLRRA